jgi:hypothetical protein
VVCLDAGDGNTGWNMVRLSPKNLETILAYARRRGMLVFIGVDGELKGYPKDNPAFSQVREMLAGLHTEMKMHIIRTQGEDPTCLSS